MAQADGSTTRSTSGPITGDAAAFRARYGPWAVVLGASEGMGEQYARQLGAAGLNVVLVARSVDKLEAIAADLRAAGVEARVGRVDLARPEAFGDVLALTEGLDVGTVVVNAGADDHGCHVLDAPLQDWIDLTRRNTMIPLQAAYHFGGAMRARGRGAILLMSSGAGWAGGARVAVYSATKAFDRNLAEGLWAELKPFGVDVLSVVVPPTDTPALRRLLDRAGVAEPPLATSADVARRALEAIGDGPTLVVNADGIDAETGATRRAMSERVSAGTAAFFGPTDG
jgi:short-subunit dehydrogenase